VPGVRNLALATPYPDFSGIAGPGIGGRACVGRCSKPSIPGMQAYKFRDPSFIARSGRRSVLNREGDRIGLVRHEDAIGSRWDVDRVLYGVGMRRLMERAGSSQGWEIEA